MSVELHTRFGWGSASIILAEGRFARGGLDANELDDYWLLCRLVVHSSLRGQGWGRKMVEWLQSKVNKIVVHPGGYDEEPGKAESFYRHMGFLETDIGFVWVKE